MAGDWIKMRTGLQRSTSVVRMASALKADRLRVIGGLHAVWSLADEQSEDGILPGYTFETVNEMIGWPGFCQALCIVGWARETPDGVVFISFEKHNGTSAKRRAQEADRKRDLRAEEAACASAPSSASVSALDADKKRTREEKRRGNTPLPPSGAFEIFWQAWPASERKEGKGKCYELWAKSGFDSISGEILAHVEACKQSERWRGGYICAPAVYLRGKRWEGAELPTAQGASW